VRRQERRRDGGHCERTPEKNQRESGAAVARNLESMLVDHPGF